MAAVIISDGRVLMGKRSSAVEWYKGLWDLPGGHVEAGETEQDAVVREVREEIGLSISRPTDEPVLRLFDRAPDGKPLAQLSVWLAPGWTGEPRNADPLVHDEVAWCDRDKVANLSLAHPEYRELLDRLIDVR